MLKNLIPLAKRFNVSRLTPSYGIYNYSSMENEMNVKMNLYYSEQAAKQFIIKQHTTFEELEEILKNEDDKIRQIQFKFNDEVLFDKNVNFLDFALNNHIDLYINNKNHAFDVDLKNGNAAFFNNTQQDQWFAKQEIPILDAEVLNNFINIYKQVLDTKYPNQQGYSIQEIQQVANEAIEVFSEKNDSVNVQNKVAIYNNLLKQLEQEKQKIEQLEVQAERKSNNFIKTILFLNIVQGAILFYMTYFLWGWDFVEPISYLLALGVETFGLYYFIKRGKGLSLQEIFQNQLFKNKKDILLSQRSTNPQKQMEFLQNKVNHLKAKIDYGKTRA